MINKILDVLIAIRLADTNVIQKSVSFCEIRLVNV